MTYTQMFEGKTVQAIETNWNLMTIGFTDGSSLTLECRGPGGAKLTAAVNVTMQATKTIEEEGM